jgi:hypothetical protein
MESLLQLSLAIILILNHTQILNLTPFQCQSSTHIPTLTLTLTLTHLSRCHPILIHLSRHNSGCSLAKRT